MKIWPSILILGIALALAVIIDRCHVPKPDKSAIDAAYNAGKAVYEDSMKIANARAEDLEDKIVDAGQATIEANRKLDSVGRLLDWYKADSRRLAKNVINAKVAKDTAGYIQNCDALADVVRDSLYDVIGKYQQQMEGLITMWQIEGKLKDSLAIELKRKSDMLHTALGNSLNNFKVLADDNKRVNSGKIYIGGIIQAPVFAVGPQFIYQFPGSGNQVSVGVPFGIRGAGIQAGFSWRVSFKKNHIFKLLK